MTTAAGAFVALASVLAAWAQPAAEPSAVPWGVSSSASAFRNHAEWFPKMSAAGVSWVRLFPEWRGIEPAQGAWKWDSADLLVKSAAEHQIQINAILMGSTPWAKGKAHAFPMTNLQDWATFVSTTVERYKKDVHYWEIWNEGNGGFNDDHHTTTDYANLVAASYAAAKKADPKAQVGMTVASFDAPYLNQAMLAMARAGKPGSFDFLCIHPYEIADGVGEPDGEIPYLWMTRLLRDALKASAPERANAEIWVTEVGRRIETRNGKTTTETDAAKTLAKLYTMGLAQGIKRTLWFEAQDPQGEDQGFGLLQRDGSPRAAYRTIKAMTACLGATPAYQGWLALGVGGRGFGFVFQGAGKPVLVAWMPAGETDHTVSFRGDVEVMNALTAATTTLPSGQPLALSDTPVFVVGVPEALVKEAQANAARNFPWGGDYASAKTVSVKLGATPENQGVFQVGAKATPTLRYPDGSTGILVRGDQSTSYYVHPSFASFAARDYYVRVTVRRVAPGNVGMNLFYEAADSQGRAPYKNCGQWFGTTADNGWQTHTWHVTDACFSKMWGFDLEIRPEQSAPFVIGKVEVSTGAF